MAKNIILVQCDSMDGRAMGCMGHKAVHTPNLDKLAASGVMFSDTYTNNPICCPARASMFSGQYTFRCKGYNNYKGLEPGTPVLMDLLSRNGYDAKTFGKTDYVSGQHTIRARVSPWTRTASIMRPNYNMDAPIVLDTDEREIHKGDWRIMREAVAEIKRQAVGGRPFFTYVGLNMPHPPFRTSKYYMDKVHMDAIEIPPKEAEQHPVIHYQTINKNWSHGTDAETVRKVRAIYYAMIAELDELMGEMLGEIDRMGIADDTYIIFTSDHGEMNMEHEQFYKMNFYEPSGRIPLILTGPGIKPGVDGTLVSLIDIFPTVAEMAGVASVELTPGYVIDGCPLLGGAKRDFAFGEYHDSSINSSAFMLRMGKYKYVAYPRFAPQLFDVVEDKWEMNNLADAMPELAKEMDRQLREICDYEKVYEEVVAYDKKAFGEWRSEQIKAGTYYDMMGKIFSGWDGIEKDGSEGKVVAWSEEDEGLIREWLGE